MATQIPIGDYIVSVQCPHCNRRAQVPAVLEQVLKVKGFEGSLTVALSAKAVPHDCQQEELPFDDTEPLLTGQDVIEAVVTAGAEALESLGSTLSEGESMTMTTVDRETGEIHEATLHGRGVRL